MATEKKSSELEASFFDSQQNGALGIDDINTVHKDNLPTDPAHIKLLIRRSYKNLWVNIFVYFILYSSFIGLAVIQSSIVGSLGTLSLALNFGAAIVGCLIVTPPMLRILGVKVTTLVSFACWLCWMVSNYYPTWYFVLPAAVISGLAVGPVFAAQGQYCAHHCIQLAKLKKQPEDKLIAQWFGVVFCFLLLGMIIPVQVFL